VSYSNYIFENSQENEFDSTIKTLSDFFISSVLNAKETNGEYIILQELEIAEPDLDVDVRFLLRKEKDISLEKDSHFKKMNWQRLKLDKNGYVVTGNVFMTDGNIPEIEITVALDSNRLNKGLFKKMYLNLINTISHELNHLKQKGWNKDYQNIDPSTQEYRKKNNKSYSYFLLPEEIESMVYGMNKQSIKQNVPIDELFDKHLDPFVESGFMNDSEKMKIIEKWLHHTLKLYPNAILSNKYSNIINNI
tara:strand:+ start:14902 stop:15648 length:747 start_codon:yes stop_codon:yes gene_type:complete